MCKMKPQKILLFEYITGGGFNQTGLPEALAKEGLLMLQALVDNFVSLQGLAVTVMIDERMLGRLIVSEDFSVQIIAAQSDVHAEFQALITQHDAIWPIAPETEGILQQLCEHVEQAGKILLNTSGAGVATAGDKWLSYLRFKECAIPTISTYKLDEFSYLPGEWIIKPRDGVGGEASAIINDRANFNTICTQNDRGLFIIQPHIVGKKTSLSCIFKDSLGWLICVNQQEFHVLNGQYQLTEIKVNLQAAPAKYQALITKLAVAFPQLWGYIGIDLIEVEDDIYVLEINPRLTSSFAGIYQATGINCAKAILQLIDDVPDLQMSNNQTITVHLNQ
jgi:tyramine---L-glutamate ligase